MDLVAYPEIEEALARWRGGWAQPWSYSVSHAQLVLKLARKGADPCAVLLLKNCLSVSFMAHWESIDFRIEPLHTGNGLRYIVRDNTRFHVDCGALFLSPEHSSFAEIDAYIEPLIGIDR